MGLVPGALAALLAVATPAVAQLSTRSVQTFGDVSTSRDSVRVPVDDPEQPADVGAGAFTIEQWLRCTDADNAPIVEDYRAVDTQVASFDWISGRIFLDRDINGDPPSGGDWGASIHRPSAGSGASVVRWGAENSAGTQLTIQGSVDVCDGGWHHVAVGRNGDDQLFIIVDGATDFVSSDTIGGFLSYPNGAGGGQDPFLVWGNEKHAFQSGFRGYLDELRAWSLARTAEQVAEDRFVTLPGTTQGLQLYLRLEEGTGQSLKDETGENAGALFYAGAWSMSAPTGGGTTSSTTSTTFGPEPSTSTSTTVDASTTSSSSLPGGSTSTSTTSSSSASGESTSSSTSSTLASPTSTTSPDGGTTSTTTSPSFPPSSTTTALSPTTSTSAPQGCLAVEDCGDLDPCTADACEAGACRQRVALGLAGATCELRRFADADLCPADPPRGKTRRSIARRLGAAARLLDDAAAAGLERPRGRRKTAAAVEKLAGADAGIRKARDKGRLAAACADTILTGLGHAQAALREVTQGVR